MFTKKQIKQEKFLKGFTNLIHFMFFLNSVNLTMEELKLLIFRYFNKETYERCAELIGKGYSKQNAEEKIKKILKKIKKQLQEIGRLEEFKFLLYT